MSYVKKAVCILLKQKWIKHFSSNFDMDKGINCCFSKLVPSASFDVSQMCGLECINLILYKFRHQQFIISVLFSCKSLNWFLVLNNFNLNCLGLISPVDTLASKLIAFEKTLCLQNFLITCQTIKRTQTSQQSSLHLWLYKLKYSKDCGMGVL